MNGTTIRTCTCVSVFQDTQYGNGKRIMNATLKGYRCTVCSKDVGEHVSMSKKR